MSKILHDVGETFSTAKGTFEVVSHSEHVGDDGSYRTYSIREKKELDIARDAQAQREADQIQADKEAEEARQTEEERVAKLREELDDPDALARQDQARIDQLEGRG